jgi:hypothetical protein
MSYEPFSCCFYLLATKLLFASYLALLATNSQELNLDTARLLAFYCSTDLLVVEEILTVRFSITFDDDPAKNRSSAAISHEINLST